MTQEGREERIARQKIRTTVYRREERAERERKTADLIAWHQEWLRRKKARVILGNIKDDHLEGKNRVDYKEIDKDLAFTFYRLNRWANELKEAEK